MPHSIHHVVDHLVARLSVSADHWLNVSLGVGAILGGAAVVVGGFFTARYGRRASVSVSAHVQRTAHSCAVVVRPSVKAVGVFKVRLKHSTVKVAEVRREDDGQIRAVDPPPWGQDDVFRSAYADGGEELQISVFVPVLMPRENVVAWAARFEITVEPRFLRRLGWFADRWWGLPPLTISPAVRRWLKRQSVRETNWYDTVFVLVPPAPEDS